MSVHHMAVWAYGFLVEGDCDEIDKICQKHNVLYAQFGNAYVNDHKYVVTTSHASNYVDSYDREYIVPLSQGVKPEAIEKMRAAAEEIVGAPVTEDPKSYIGLYIF